MMLSMLNVLSVKVSTKHQIVVPSAVRRQLGIKAGDRLEVRIEDGDGVLHPPPGPASEGVDALGCGGGGSVSSGSGGDRIRGLSAPPPAGHRLKCPRLRPRAE